MRALKKIKTTRVFVYYLFKLNHTKPVCRAGRPRIILQRGTAAASSETNLHLWPSELYASWIWAVTLGIGKLCKKQKKPLFFAFKMFLTKYRHVIGHSVCTQTKSRFSGIPCNFFNRFHLYISLSYAVLGLFKRVFWREKNTASSVDALLHAHTFETWHPEFVGDTSLSVWIHSLRVL